MKPEHDPRELCELFDRSANIPDAATLERLELQAARVARHVPRTARTRWWAPSLLAAAAAVAIYSQLPRENPSDATARVPEPAASPALGSANATPQASAAAHHPELLAEEDEVVDVLDDLALEPGDLSDAELDAWVSAASSSLGG